MWNFIDNEVKTKKKSEQYITNSCQIDEKFGCGDANLYKKNFFNNNIYLKEDTNEMFINKKTTKFYPHSPSSK
jgi:hypothetical protein